MLIFETGLVLHSCFLKKADDPFYPESVRPPKAKREEARSWRGKQERRRERGRKEGRLSFSLLKDTDLEIKKRDAVIVVAFFSRRRV